MEQAEIERLIGELEIGLDRLRSLYDQYFMGIERIEPTVARKDADRRIYVLRREQIRNTALRFRFQMLLQRYNTFQSHWQRICREIESGTYKRHLARAQQRFGETGTGPMAAAARRAAARPEPGAMPTGRLAAELAELDAEFAPAALDVEVVFEEEEATTVARPSPLARRAPLPPTWRKTEVPARAGTTATPAPPPAPPRPPAVPRPVAGAPRPAAGVPRPGPAVPRPAGAVRTPATAAPPTTAAPRPATAVPPPPAPATSASTGPVPPAPSPAPRAKEPGELPEERVRQIYSQFVDSKRRQNESTAAITYDAVAQSLRDSSAKLREKHAGKAVDFEVRVKDGKTILKPVVR